MGVWNNPLDSNEAKQKQAIELCQQKLALADAIGARCCVNISGSRGEIWDDPHADNYTDGTFDLVVQTTRRIFDAVKPTRTFFSLETMPWMIPDSVDGCLELFHAIDRPRFAVQLDPLNLLNTPRLYYHNSILLRDCFDRLGPYIKSCHAKDITLATGLTVHLSEVRPGLGGLDYVTFLRGLNKPDPDLPLILEHLPNPDDYLASAEQMRGVPEAEGVPL